MGRCSSHQDNETRSVSVMRRSGEKKLNAFKVGYQLVQIMGQRKKERNEARKREKDDGHEESAH